MPLDVDPRPRSLRIGLGGPPPAGGRVRIRVNDCVLHDGPIDSTPWYRTWSLDACDAIRSGAEADIVIQSSATNGPDGKPRGVAVEVVQLFSLPWPPPPPPAEAMSALLALDGGLTKAVARTAPVGLRVQNTGAGVWARVAGAGAPVEPGNALELRWRQADGAEDRTQRLRLPRVLYPGESAHVEVPLVPPPAVDHGGPWEVRLVPVSLQGAEIRTDAPVVISVTAAPAR